MRCRVSTCIIILFTIAGHLEAVLLASKASSNQSVERGRCGPLFATILTTPDNVKRRQYIREMWRDSRPQWGMSKAKFAVCSPGGEENASLALRVEQADEGDLMFLECEEGYNDGKLTRKVMLAMQTFLYDYPEFDFFMKIDDDTFISHRRLCDLFVWRRDNQKNNAAAYFGVFAEGPTEALYGQHFPDRNRSSPWYEPESTFPRDVYPTSAKGGPGYILPRELVDPIIKEGIASKQLLHNEDKAVGVWVDELQSQGRHIDYVNIPGTDGYDTHSESIVKTGPYKNYPFTLHHHLKGPIIACLHKIDIKQDKEALIDECFDAVDGDYA